ncbi:hypothetical protein, partial [Laceyella sediminis]|uniref:hypothetical protein n=1 Tax=Laceyella sediminis TaxID=573074 RepID=UPI001C62A79B
AMLLSRAGKGGGFKFIWVDIHPLIVYIPFIYQNPAINKVDSQGLSTFSFFIFQLAYSVCFLRNLSYYVKKVRFML